MLRLPAPEDYGISSPRPSRGVTEISPVQVRPDLATGKAMQDIGLLMQQEAEKLDETVALDALNQLQNKQLDLTYGDNGFTKVQGKGVIDRKITAEFPTQLQTEAERLAGTINSPRARAAFEARAGSVMRGFKANVYTHAAKETETYHVQTEEARISTTGQAANLAAARGDVESVAKELTAARETVEGAIRRRGLEGPQADELRQKGLGAVHSNVLEGLLQGNQPALASAWLKTNRAEMTVAQAKQFDGRIKTEESWARGDTMVRDLMAQGKTTAEIESAVAAESKKSGDKALYDSAVHTLGNITLVRTKAYAENADRAQDEINRGAPWGKIRSKYLDSMDPTAVAAFDDRAKQLAKEGRVKTDFETYYELSSMSPDKMAGVNLRSYVGKLSDGDLKHFAEVQRKIQNKETPDAVKLSAQLSAAHNELGWGNKPVDRKKKGMFDQYVNESVIAEEARTGKKMNDDEREKLIKKAMITKDLPWYKGGAEMFYEIPEAKRANWLLTLEPEQRKQLGTVLAVRDVPAADRTAITASYKKKGLAAPTESQILDAYREKHRLK